MKTFLLSILFMFTVLAGNAQIIDIPDANLKAHLLLSDDTNQIAYNLDGDFLKIDVNNDGEIQLSEANQVSRLAIYPESTNGGGYISISSFLGLENFSNLTELVFDQLIASDSTTGSNDTIEGLTSVESLQIFYSTFPSLNLMNMTNLIELRVLNSEISYVNFSDCNCINFEELSLEESQISSINLSSLENLTNLYLFYIELGSLDLTNNLNLEILNLTATSGISELNLSQNQNLKVISFNFNGQLTVDLSVLPNLEAFTASDTNIPDVDLSQSPNLDYLSINNVNINFLNLKNGTIADTTDLFYSNIDYLCADENEVDGIDISNANIQAINSYCSFTPGGDYYLVEGQNKVDANFDGCDANDYLYPNLKFNISNANFDWTYFTDATGNYSIPLSEGSHTLVYELENSDYFTVSQSSVSVNFPSDINPNIQDFCITPIGTYNDLEVVIVPLGLAIPGFDAYYKILYKNKGNSLLSGSVELDYSLNSNVVQFISALPSNDSETNNILLWDYTDLAPFETREIILSFNLNTPIDPDFPLNSDDELAFIANISPFNDDETPSDNTFELKQIVVNSYDPNDIRCLEGESILPEDVGKYVHYLIRFENLGTANAINVVVKNTIDDTKFDLNTLIPIDGSHDYVTRINPDNDIEFIFENIQLPFDDANNDGYVVYKIKTLDTLVLGDEFSNQAEIYFDFNAPVITNNYTTLVAEENLGESDFSLSITKAYPNPVSNTLTIETEFDIDTISIYDIEGRKVLEVLQDNANQIDMSALQAGIYFVKVFSDSKTETLKVIKN